MFHTADSKSKPEIQARRESLASLCTFGIQYLDDACNGISPHDLVVLGAPSGAGKTELCCKIALSNMAMRKKVHYIALEAEPMEIERRLKYQVFATKYFEDAYPPKTLFPVTYANWRLGRFLTELIGCEDYATDFFSENYKNLSVMYKSGTFGVDELIQAVTYAAVDTSLIIIDHVHYFDLGEGPENRAIKEIAIQARDLALEFGKPIILVSHLRKRDRAGDELCAGLDEFHGSSDLTKIATKVISVAPGQPTSNGNFETFLHVPKDRVVPGLSRYVGRILFDPRKNAYSSEYKVGLSICTRKSGFEELAHVNYPDWARGRGVLRSGG